MTGCSVAYSLRFQNSNSVDVPVRKCEKYPRSHGHSLSREVNECSPPPRPAPCCLQFQVPNRSNMKTCLRKPLDDVSPTSRRPNISVFLDDVPPPRESIQTSRRLFRHREDPLPITLSPKHVPRSLDEVVTHHREDPLPKGVHKSCPSKSR